MARQDMLIDAIAQMFAGQPVMLNIVDQFQLPNSNKSLKGKEERPGKTVDTKGQKRKANLQHNISQQGIFEWKNPRPARRSMALSALIAEKKHCFSTLGKNR